jgi:hypothetical protein
MDNEFIINFFNKVAWNFVKISTKSNSEIFARIKAERKEVGYYNLPCQDTVEIKDCAQGVSKKHIVVLGNWWF